MKFNHFTLSKISICILLLGIANSSFGQKIIKDSRGKDILEFYKGGAIQGDFSPTQTSLAVSYSQVLGIPKYYYVGDSVTGKTVGKSHALSLTGKVEGSGTDEGKPFNALKGLVRPSYRLEVGYQRTIDKFYDIRNLPGVKPTAYSAGINVFGELQDINLYDTIAKVQSNRKPFVYGLHGHFTIFNKWGFKKGLFSDLTWAFSLSADISNTYNSEDFIPYQERSSTGYMDANILALGDEAGNIGTYSRSGAYRLRASLPIFLSQYINVTPYASIYGFTGGTNNWLPGFAVNFFGGSPRTKNSGLEEGFGIAIDWPKTKGVWKGANVAIYGTLSMDKLKKAIKAVAE